MGGHGAVPHSLLHQHHAEGTATPHPELPSTECRPPARRPQARGCPSTGGLSLPRGFGGRRPPEGTKPTRGDALRSGITPRCCKRCYGAGGDTATGQHPEGQWVPKEQQCPTSPRRGWQWGDAALTLVGCSHGSAELTRLRGDGGAQRRLRAMVGVGVCTAPGGDGGEGEGGTGGGLPCLSFPTCPMLEHIGNGAQDRGCLTAPSILQHGNGGGNPCVGPRSKGAIRRDGDPHPSQP